MDAVSLVRTGRSILSVLKKMRMLTSHPSHSLFIAFLFALPVGIVQAVTNQQGALNVYVSS
jgi:bifunctional DNase/RNase